MSIVQQKMISGLVLVALSLMSGATNDVTATSLPYVAGFVAAQPSDREILAFLAGKQWPKSLDAHDKLLEEVFRAGPLSDASKYPAAMKNLAAIVEFDPAAASDEQRMRTAVAVALEFAAGYIRKGPVESVARYQWYRDAQADGRLHKSFDELQSWERRFVVNLPWHHGDGSNEQLDWLNLNVKLPPEQYSGACWQAPYAGNNPFGESVQGPLYYVPFQDELDAYEMRREVGAVCGGLSHYGAAAARANGIGATTMGEPGHCSYAIRINKKWKPCYSLSPDRNAHQSILLAAWQYVELQEVAFADPEKTLSASRLAGWALMLAAKDSRESARIAIKACEVQPQNPFLWELRFKLLHAAGLDNPSAWWDQASAMGEALAGYPLVVVTTLGVLDQKTGVNADAAQRGRMMAAALKQAMGKSASKAPPTDWKKVFNKVYAFSGKELSEQANVCRAIAEDILKGPDGEQFIEDAMIRFGSDDQMLDLLVDATFKGLKENRTQGEDSKARMAENGMRTAAGRHDCEAFQKFASLHPSPHSENMQPPKVSFEGKLLSDEGSIRMSSTSRWDHAAGHAGVLSMKGGKFHTGNAENEWVEVTLTRIAKLSGIIIDNVGGNSQRAVPLTVEVSVDGQKWEQVFQTDKDQPQWQISLSDSNPVARFIRINGSVGRQDFLHLRRILIYGKPQS